MSKNNLISLTFNVFFYYLLISHISPSFLNQRSIEALKLKSNVEKATLNDIHMNTIKVSIFLHYSDPLLHNLHGACTHIRHNIVLHMCCSV